jgi:acetyltransferase-like isoleucine patch superfamily enzyme
MSGPTDDGTAGAQRLADLGAQLGTGVTAWLGSSVTIGSDVRIGDGCTIVADRLELGDGVGIGNDCDLRSAEISLGDRTEILDNVRVLVADGFEVGNAGRIEGSVSITARRFRAGRLFYFGHDSSVGYGGTTASTAIVTIGHRVALGPHNILNANLPIRLDDQVGSGCYLSIWTHGFHFGHRLSDGYAATFEGVHIEPNVWLGFHVSVLPGVTIGENTILAAGAVVSRSLPADVLAGGVPAKALKPLNARAISDDELWSLVEHLLNDWCTELTWKGVPHERRGPLKVAVGDTVVLGASDRTSLPDAEPGQRELIVLTSGRSTEVAEPKPGQVLFGLRSGTLTGTLSTVGHDLRDHLRRHALPCGDDEPYRGLPSAPFARLLLPSLPITP